MRYVSIIMLIGLFLLGASESRRLPYTSIDAITADEIVFKNTEYCSSKSQPVAVMGLHHGTEWWKLWAAPTGFWIFGFYADGPNIPDGEVYPKQLYFGRLDGSIFQLVYMALFNEDSPSMCDWLYPKKS